MGKLTLLLLAILVWLQYSLWFGKTVYMTIPASMMMWRHSKLQTRNLKRETINFLPKLTISMAAEALEERARNELSMTRPGETFYRLVPDASKRAQSAGQNNR